jgi:hypothetical protein
MLRVGYATLAEPVGEAVFVGEIFIGGRAEGVGRGEADAPPFEAAIDGPLQDPPHSALVFSGRSGSRSAGGTVTVNGIR